MNLLFSKSFEQEPKLVARNPTSEDLHKLVRSIDWNSLTVVILEKDGSNYLDISGSLQDDGIVAALEINGEPFVNEIAPTTVNEVEEILSEYLHSKTNFVKKFDFRSHKEDISQNSSSDKRNFEKWKEQYHYQLEIDRRKSRFRLLLVVLVTVVLLLLIYFGLIV